MVGINRNRINKQAYNNNVLYQYYGINPNVNYLLAYQDINPKTNKINITGLEALYIYGLNVFHKVVGRPIVFTKEEAKERTNQRRRDKYAKQVEQYKKDTDNSLSTANTKKWVVDAFKALYSQYHFNYLITLQHGFVFDAEDGKATYILPDKTDQKGKKHTDKEAKKYLSFDELRSQKKYQIKKCYNEQQCLDEALSYIRRLKKNDKYIFDNYFITIHKSHYDNSYHAHIAINIVDTSIVNVHTYLANRWYKSTRKKKMVKKIHNQSELIGYMIEEKKRLNADIVLSECNLNRHSKRLVNQSDLTDGLKYALNTFTHPETQKTLLQYGIC